MVESLVSGEPTSPEPQPPAKRSASALVAAGIMFSRISGLVREAIFSSFLGVGGASDAFGVATRVPNVLQMLLGEGTLSASFIPVYSAELERDEEEAGRIAGAVAALLALVAATIVIVSWVFAEPIASVMARGFRDDARFDLTVSLMRIILPSAGMLVLSAWCLGILNSHRQFFLSYVAPVLWNIAQIAAITGAVLFFDIGKTSPTDDLEDISTNVAVLGDLAKVAAWGFFVGSFLQFLVQVPNVRKLVRGLRIRLDLQREGVREVVRRFGGAVLARGVIQISALIDIFLAGLLITGAVTTLVKTQVLYILPISLFAISIAASELPELSRLSDKSQIRRRAQAGFGQILFFMSFTAFAYILLGDKIVGALFERGQFTADDTLLIWFALGGVLTWPHSRWRISFDAEHVVVPGRHPRPSPHRHHSRNHLDRYCGERHGDLRPAGNHRCSRCASHAVRRRNHQGTASVRRDGHHARIGSGSLGRGDAALASR